MKKLLICVLCSLLWNCVNNTATHNIISDNRKQLGDGYSTFNNEIYYKKSYPPYSSMLSPPVKSEADFITFTNLGNRYAKDKDNIYYQGLAISNVDKNSFSVVSIENEFPNLPDKTTSTSSNSSNKIEGILTPRLSSNYFKNFIVLTLEFYSKDKLNVYYGGDIIPKADPDSFELLSLFFSKDRNNAYYIGKPITGSDPSSFELIAGRLTRDYKYIFYNDEIISTNPESFILLNDNYAKDEKNVWFFRNLTFTNYDILNVSSPNEFKIIDYRYASDSKRVFFHGDLISDVDLQSYQILGNNWSKDNKNIYYGSKLCKEVDYDTFEVTEDGAKDKNRTYDRNYRPSY